VPNFVPDSTELPESPQTHLAQTRQIWLARAVPARLIIRRSLVRVQPAPSKAHQPEPFDANAIPLQVFLLRDFRRLTRFNTSRWDRSGITDQRADGLASAWRSWLLPSSSLPWRRRAGVATARWMQSPKRPKQHSTNRAGTR